jgi:hypothetical protein
VDHHVESGLAGVERGGLDAVVEREAGHVHLLGVVLAQQPLELGPVEPRVALGITRLTLVDDGVDGVAVDQRVKLRALGVLDTVDRPPSPLLRE